MAKIVLPLIWTALTVGCGGESPRILEIDPKFAVVGQNLTIMGECFGKEQGESFVTIGGVRPTLSSYIEWSDDKIVVRIPDFGEAGLIYVHKQNKQSNPVLFPMLGSIPKLPESQTSYAPAITRINPASAAIGQSIMIQGNGFGSARNGSAVLFSWIAERLPSVPAEVSPPPLIEASGYEAWSEHEIRVRVCDGAASGVVQLVTPRGKSAAAFEVTGKPGVKIIRDKRTYSISYSVDVRAEHAAPPNIMYLWRPIPASTASQLNKETLSDSAESFVEDYQGAALYRLTDLKSGDTRRLSVSYLVDVYGAETQVQPNLVRQYADSPVFRAWTKSSPLVPSDDAAIKETAAAYIGSERNPYLKALAIYRNFLKDFTVTADVNGASISQSLQEKQADPYTAAMLYCALCRAAGIPAIPIAGVLCAGTGTARAHYWAEFWIDNFGWIPVDPALGAGFVPDTFKPEDDHAAYYFGNMDNRHLIFSYGETSHSQIDARGRAAGQKRNYSLQNIWEEASGGIDAYSSHWSDINVMGVYSN
jgi:transglutaminase-like putative cysteine protease